MSRDSWWVDFLENDVEPGLKEDMEKLLAKSGKDRASLDALASLRQWVADSDPAQDLWKEEKMAALTEKINRAVKATPLRGKSRRKTSARLQDVESSPDFSSKRAGL